MKNKWIFVSILLIVTAVVAFSSTFFYVKINENVSSSSQFTVVTSCNPVYMATLNICDGVEGVQVTNLSQPTTGCLHDYTLTTGDMKVLSKADVFVINGAGMEGFLTDVMEAYPELTIVDSSEGLLKEDANSHCWMSLSLYEAQLGKIAEALCALDEGNAKDYASNANNYIAQLEDQLRPLYDDGLTGQPVILFHEAFEYIADDFEMNVAAVMDLDEERQVSAGEVHDITKLAQDEEVKLLIAEEAYGADMAGIVSESTGAKTIFLDTMIRGNYDKDSYITIMKQNLTTLSGWSK